MWPWPKEFGIIMPVFISNIIWKFDEKILRNAKVTANVKFFDGLTADGQSDPYDCIFFSWKHWHKNYNAHLHFVQT